jgi:hypothetical protein
MKTDQQLLNEIKGRERVRMAAERAAIMLYLYPAVLQERNLRYLENLKLKRYKYL